MDRGTTEVVDKFRSYILHSNKAAGLEFMMKDGLGVGACSVPDQQE